MKWSVEDKVKFINQFKRALINCVNWYNKERIKLVLKMSPIRYRLKYNKT